MKKPSHLPRLGAGKGHPLERGTTNAVGTAAFSFPARGPSDPTDDTGEAACTRRRVRPRAFADGTRRPLCRRPHGARAAVAWLGLLVWLHVHAAPPPAPGQTGPSTPAPAAQPVELRGQVVCLPEQMHALHGTELPAEHEHLYGLKTTDGAFYTLLRTKLSEALFLDPRLRDKQLLLKGRVLPNSHVFDVLSFKSLRDGRVCDLYYYCDICAITAVSPRPCLCCQGPMELVEKPPSSP